MTDVPLNLPDEPVVEPSRGPADWLRRNLFRSWLDTAVTIVSSVIVGYVIYRLVRFIAVTGRWDIVERNLTLLMVGRYPRDELWRVAVAMIVVSAIGGLVIGYVHARQVDAERAAAWRPFGRRVGALATRLWPLILGVIVLLGFTRTITPTLILLGAIAAAVAGRIVGGHFPKRAFWPLVVGTIVVVVALVFLLNEAIGWDDWGGILLNLILAAGGIGLSFPLGILLALGRRAGRNVDSATAGIAVAVLLAIPILVLLYRRGFAPDDGVAWGMIAVTVGAAFAGYRLGRASSLPLVRIVSVAYIEFFRGVPLYVLLLLGFLGIGFFLPPGTPTPSLVVRATIVFVLFTSAYIAEIVRGGLQSLPRGQTEAAQALGLSPVKTTSLIVLPQALRNVIPAIVGQFISLFKDTTLAGAAMGVIDLLAASGIATGQPAFRGQGLTGEVVGFVMFVFWVGCITMSRESQRLERKLGVGTR